MPTAHLCTMCILTPNSTKVEVPVQPLQEAEI